MTLAQKLRVQIFLASSLDPRSSNNKPQSCLVPDHMITLRLGKSVHKQIMCIQREYYSDYIYVQDADLAISCSLNVG